MSRQPVAVFEINRVGGWARVCAWHHPTSNEEACNRNEEANAWCDAHNLTPTTTMCPACYARVMETLGLGAAKQKQEAHA